MDPVAVAEPCRPLALRGMLAARVHRLASADNRALFLELLRAGIKVNDHNSVLGTLWGLLNPITLFLVLYLVFRKHFGAGIDAYPLFLLVGVSVLNFFTAATRALVTVFAANRHLLLNSTIPRETLVAATVATHAYKLVVELVLCGAVSAWYGRLAWSTVLGVVPVLLGLVALTLGIGLLGALAYCFVRDVEHLWGLGTRLLLFVSPVFYDLSSLSALPRTLIYWANPVTPFLVAFRGLFIQAGQFDALACIHSVVVGLVVLTVAFAVFLRWEGEAVERA